MSTTRQAGIRPIVAAAFLLALPGAACAAPPSGAAATRVAQTDQDVRPVNVESEEDTAICNRSRRRLWVEGEGWIVRRITTCR